MRIRKAVEGEGRRRGVVREIGKNAVFSSICMNFRSRTCSGGTRKSLGEDSLPELDLGLGKDYSGIFQKRLFRNNPE